MAYRIEQLLLFSILVGLQESRVQKCLDTLRSGMLELVVDSYLQVQPWLNHDGVMVQELNLQAL